MPNESEPTKLSPAPVNEFEGTNCAKCGGTGKHAQTGLECFYCDGGRVLTKRGKSAWAFYLAELRKPARTFIPGESMLWQMPNGPANFFTVLDIAPDIYAAVPDFVLIKFLFGSRSMWQEASCRFGASGETKLSARRRALAYQAVLDKDGRDPERKKRITDVRSMDQSPGLEIDSGRIDG